MSPPPREPLLHHLFRIGGACVFAWSLIYAGLVYVFVFDRVAPSGTTATVLGAVAINVALFTLFALHHSVFARLGVKEWLQTVVPPALERSVYVWCASLLFVLLMRAWQDLPGVFWNIEGTGRIVCIAVQLGGVVITALASRRVGVRTLAGLDTSQATAPSAIERSGLYGFVRHPIYFAWLLMVWPAPMMTGSRLLFAMVSTAYLVIAIPFEERSLRRHFGPAYADYQREVRWRMIPGIY